jgi:hypothetical protein
MIEIKGGVYLRLEYRLDDEIKHFPALWHYDHLSISEIVSRMTCEYFVKDGSTYHVTMTVKEPEGLIVIYVTKEEFKEDQFEKIYQYIGFEMREIQRSGDSKLLEGKELFSHDEAMDVLHCDVIYVNREGEFLEFKLDSREIDEDRKCYVYYGTFTGNE